MAAQGLRAESRADELQLAGCTIDTELGVDVHQTVTPHKATTDLNYCSEEDLMKV